MNTASVSIAIEPTTIDAGNRASARGLPTTIADDMLYEVVDGKALEKEFHAREAEIASILFDFMGNFARTNRVGRMFILLLFRIDRAKNLQRRPDVAFVSHARWPVHRRLPDVEEWDIVPDLVVEVVNPTDTAIQVHEKIHEYFEAGVNRVWVVYPGRKEIYVYASPTQIQVLQIGQELDGGDLVPGFRLPLAALFEDDAE